MSAFGSSVVNKSGKKLAPKAAPRRRPATSAVTAQPISSSLRSSAEPLQPVPSEGGAALPNAESPIPDNIGTAKDATVAGPSQPQAVPANITVPVIEAQETASTSSQPTLGTTSQPTLGTKRPSPQQSSTEAAQPVEPPAKRRRVESRSIESDQPDTNLVASQTAVFPVAGLEASNQNANSTGKKSKTTTKGKSKDDWVITTPADVSKSTTRNVRQRGAKSKVAKTRAQSSETPATTGVPEEGAEAGREPQTAPDGIIGRVTRARKRKRQAREPIVEDRASAGSAGIQDDGDGANDRPEIADGGNAENGANGAHGAHGANGANGVNETNEANDDDVVNGEDGEDEEENGTNATRRRKRHRAGTPEGAEEVTIVPAIVTLWELASGNRRTGIKSEREKLMKEIEAVASLLQKTPRNETNRERRVGKTTSTSNWSVSPPRIKGEKGFGSASSMANMSSTSKVKR
jgi:hypothetical protein